MSTKNWNADFMSQIIDEDAWRKLSDDFPWSERLLEKYRNKVHWDRVSRNPAVHWTASMLEKFKDRLDWEDLSRDNHQSILTAELFERFKDRWDWSELSGNSNIEMTYELIDCWDWQRLINRWREKLSDRAFLERYKEHIPVSDLQRSELWIAIVKQRQQQLAREIAPAAEYRCSALV